MYVAISWTRRESSDASGTRVDCRRSGLSVTHSHVAGDGDGAGGGSVRLPDRSVIASIPACGISARDRAHVHDEHCKGHACLTVIEPIPWGGLRQMSLKRALQATPRIPHVTMRAGHPSSWHSHGPWSAHVRRQRQI